MQHTPAVAMCKPIDNLLEGIFSELFLQSLLLFDELKEVPTSSILHDHQEMLWTFKDFKQSNDV
jgi:hypothetical protein